jgi:L,D-transpeptidase ErfK/SrfK
MPNTGPDSKWIRTAILCISTLLSVLILCSSTALPFSGAFFIEDTGSVFGFTRKYKIKDDGETLISLAITYDLGYNEVVDANPGIDPWYPGKGLTILLPTSWILPDVDDLSIKKGKQYIVINLAELRLYLLKNEDVGLRVITFPIGIGREGLETPTGNYRIISKLKDPAWYIPESIRNEYPELPEVVPPGPENPLGRYALKLSMPEYLIHGTNKPLGVGRRVSHGCIRMYPEDIERLYSLVGIGDEVIIIYQPVKIGHKKGRPYIEVHKDYYGSSDQFENAVELLRKRNLLHVVDTDILNRAVNERLGVPVSLKK